MRIEINGVPVNYEIKGQGSPVLLLHGWGGCIGSFAPVAEVFSANYQTVSLDFPGHGLTPEPPEAWSVTEYMEMTAQFIRRMDLGACDIIAHSFGGRVAILLSATYPELVHKLVLCDSAGLIPRRGLKYKLRVARHKLGKKLARIGWIDRLLHLTERARNAGSADYRALSDSMKKVFVRVVNQDLRPYLKGIKAPTLLIWGSEDRDTPLSFAHIMEAEIPDAGLVVFEGAGHFSYLDEFQRFCPIVSVFFGGR